MQNVKYITINGFDFIITKEFDFNGIHYMVAIDENAADTVAILKQSFIDGKEFVESVTDEDELEMVFEIIKREENN